MTQLLIFGDSIAQGFWDVEGGGWAQRLKIFLDNKSYKSKKYFFDTFNLAVDGNTSEDVLRRFEFEVSQRAEEEGDNIILIAIGSNDCAFDNKTVRFLVGPQRYEENLAKIFEIAKKYSRKIFFVGFTPVNESKTVPVPWIDISYKNKDTLAYENIAKKICKKKRIHFIEIFNQIKDADKWADGLHPESKSHKKIFEIVKKELVKQKII